MNNNKADSFTLDEVLVYPPRNEVEAHGRVLRLQPQVMEVLCYLAHHYDRVIPNDELMEQVWRGRVVTHGSIQKSINMLRKSFVELVGERDLVAHYSKRGYQLQITPVFLQAQDEHGLEPLAAISRITRGRARWLVGLFALALLASATAGYAWLNRYNLLLDTSHRTSFNRVQSYTRENGRERAGEPHPDGRHLAYVREAARAAAGNDAESHLVIRNSSGQDWLFASAQGVWTELAWSPSGRQLAAVELMREEGEPWALRAGAEPAGLYDIHVFSLDLANNRVLGKHRLSQWQGTISSITWWDEDIIELVARQGDSSTNLRYRYSLKSQRLATVELPAFVANPLLTRIHKGKTAMVSLHNGAIRIDFLAEDQQRFASSQLPYDSVDLSWLPDGSGVLVYSPEDRALAVVYRNGKVKALSFPGTSDGVMSRPRYSSDGQRVFYTEEHLQADIWQASATGRDVQLTDNGYLNGEAVFSPDGEKIAYVSVRNNQPQVWLYDKGVERQIAASHSNAHIDDLLWTRDGAGLLYKSTDTIHLYGLAEASDVILAGDARDLTPLALFPDKHVLLTLRLAGQVRNLWWMNLQSGEEKQLTFGSVDSAIEYRGDIYFTYASQQGLWVLHKIDGTLELVNRTFDESSRLLYADDGGVFYVTGGECRESSIYYLNMKSGTRLTHLSRNGHRVATTSFHPQQGALYTLCRPAESNIMVLE